MVGCSNGMEVMTRSADYYCGYAKKLEIINKREREQREFSCRKFGVYGVEFWRKSGVRAEVVL